MNEIASSTIHVTICISLATSGRGLHMLKASSKRKRTSKEMTEFKSKEHLQQVEKEETENKLIT